MKLIIKKKEKKLIFFLKIPGPKFFKFQFFFFRIHCWCCGFLLTKSDIKPTYQSRDNRAPHNLKFFDPGDKPWRYNGIFFLRIMTLDLEEKPVKFLSCMSNHLRDIKVQRYFRKWKIWPWKCRPRSTYHIPFFSEK